MKEKSKIKVLTPEEIKRQTTSAYSGDDSSESGCKLTQTCYDGTKLSCSGAKCGGTYEEINGKKYLKSIQCFDAEGKKTGGGECDNSKVDSGVASNPYTACDKKKEGAKCEWYDGSKTIVGQCTKDQTGLYCK